MPKISGLDILTGPSLDPADLVVVVDGSDPTMSATTGTDKKMTTTEFAAGLQLLNAGTALLTGRAGGQTFAGGTGPDDDLIFKASSAGSPTGDIVFLGGAAGNTELGRMINNGQLTWNGPIVAVGPTSSFGSITTAGDVIAASGTVTAGAVTAPIGTFGSTGQTFIGPGVSTTGGFGGLTFVGSEQGSPGLAAACCLDLRGGRSDGSGNSALSQNGDVLARLMLAGSCRTTGTKIGVAQIFAVATENYTDTGPGTAVTANGARMEFWTSPNGSNVGLNHGRLAMTLDNDASLSVVGAITAPAITVFGITTSAVVFGAGGPSIVSGTGVPVSTAPNGSLFLRTDGTGPNLYKRVNGTWVADTA